MKKIIIGLVLILLSLPSAWGAVVTHGGTLPDSSQKSDFYALIDSATISGIVNADVSSSAAIVASKLDLSSPGTIGNTVANTGKFTTIQTTGNVGIGTPVPSSYALIVSGGNVGVGTGLPSALLEVGNQTLDILSNGNVGIGSINPGQILDVKGTIRATSFSGPIASSYVKVSNTQTQNTSGGTATSGAWRVIPFNTKDSDTGSIATLSSNQISLPSGTYKVSAYCPFRRTDMSQTRLYNITDSAVLLTGTAVSSSATDDTHPISVITGQFTLAGTKTIEVDYQVTTTQATSGLGSQGNFGPEVYAVAEFTKLS